MGKIEIITGPMFSGKTTELMRRLERYTLAGNSVVLFKPPLDNRTENEIATSSVRQAFRTQVLILHKPIGIEAGVVAIDEAQFFGEWILTYAQSLKDQDKIVIISGLDMDAHRRPFGFMGQLMAIADSVSKLTAVCRCGEDAGYTWLKDNIPQQKGNLILIGDSERYEPRCRKCYARP
ncbi:MAG: thymidine kinase [Syntrophomonadaceae bacterium]|nr:thymidine kinase [Syntrophomonadaceae bacterium]